MDWTIRDCINYAHNQGLIGEVNHNDLINELDDLYQDQQVLTNIKLYGEEDPNEKTTND